MVIHDVCCKVEETAPDDVTMRDRPLLNSSLKVFAILLEALLYSKFSANPSRLLFEGFDHELLHHLVTENERWSGVELHSDLARRNRLAYYWIKPDGVLASSQRCYHALSHLWAARPLCK
jgi:hypothetical protein